MNISYELRARLALEKHGFRNTHSLGQNFILDESLLSALISLAGIGPDDNVLEIGPGPGLLTALLSERCHKVTSIEIDEKLASVLNSVLEGRDNAKIVFGDAMRIDIKSVIAENFGDAPVRVVANLPYYITTDVIMRLVTGGFGITDINVMVQKEAAERIMSRPGSKAWCAAAAVIDYFSAPEVLTEVPRTAFEPPPHVDSAFIKLDLYENKPVSAISDAMMLKTINAAFLMRRKKLTNNLKAAFSITQQDAIQALQKAGIDQDIRGEVLTINELAALSDVLTQIL